MPQPASSVAAPAAASTLARHPGLTVSLLSALAVYFAAPREIPPAAAGVDCPGRVEETGATMLARRATGKAQRTTGRAEDATA
jgi:hypothetical protein